MFKKIIWRANELKRNITRYLIVQIRKQQNIVMPLAWFIIYFPLLTAYQNAFLILVLSATLNFSYHYFKKQLKKKEKYSVPLYDQIFCIFPYFIMFFFLINSSYQYSFLWFNLNLGLSLPTVNNLFKIFLKPGIMAFKQIIGHKQGIDSLFLFYFQYFYVARNKTIFSYFVRYNFVYCILLTQLIGFVDSCFSVWKKYHLSIDYTDFNSYVGTNIFGLFLCLILYGLIMTFIGKQPILPFLDEAIEFHIGSRKLQDESLIDRDDNKN